MVLVVIHVFAIVTHEIPNVFSYATEITTSMTLRKKLSKQNNINEPTIKF